MGRYNCEFIYIVDETRMADIVIKDGIVTSTRYTDVALNLPFGNQPDSSISREQAERMNGKSEKNLVNSS